VRQAGSLEKRLGRLRRALAESGLEGAIVAPGPNMRYYTGVSSIMLERPFLLFVKAEDGAHLVAPSLEAGPYRSCPVKLEIHEWTDSEGPGGAFREAARAVGFKGRWGVEGRVPFLYLDQLKKAARVELESAEQILQAIREVKDEQEVKLLKRSAEILSRVFEEIPEMLEEGVTEEQLARSVSEAIRERGSGVGDMLVQAGERGAFPHGLPTSRKISRGEPVIVDVSSSFEGYYADITRTFCLGRSEEMERVYSEVLEAQERAIRAVGDGVAVGDVDRAARGHLNSAGLGRYFIHRTGHGLGLEVHEAPYIVEGGREKLRECMFFTVEPGVYLPGKMGVRIEDNVTLERGHSLVITDTPKEFGWWK
jgi:Xaa-Pro dipeptidase